jgi:hypothetical protein
VDEDLGFFVALERQVWDALRRGDGKADGRLLADSYLGVYESGFAAKAEHVAQVSSGPAVTEFELLTPRLMRLSPVLALLAYEARWRGRNGRSRAAYITSIWERGGEGWRNIFSQDTERIDG